MKLLRGDCLKILRKIRSQSVASLVCDPPAGISFMGKDWDGDRGGRAQWIAWMTEVMRECHRVLKPGAHGLVWALPRTSHWTATALEDAGFEVRDVVTHLFGSGFPKSLCVSKAIDKAAGAEREITGHEPRLVNSRAMSPNGDGERTCDPSVKRDKPATVAAKQWQGFGTALKPASEHWILVRKPLGEKTVAANVIKHGTGALNIDASRIEAIRPAQKYTAPDIRGGQFNSDNSEKKRHDITQPENLGRFPANLVFSHNPECVENPATGVTVCEPGCAVAALNAQSGTLKSGAGQKNTRRSPGNTYSAPAGANDKEFSADSGGASRFFYCAKISKAERNAGADNNHPTVKPRKLMEYLIRMVTPCGGIVLDPFMGSGSTGVAAVSGGFKFIGIEQDKDFYRIAKRRVAYATPKPAKKLRRIRA